MHGYRRYKDCRPIGRKQAGKAREGEVGRALRSLKRHENNEARDREKQLHTVVAEHKPVIDRDHPRQDFWCLDRIVEQDHRQRGNTAQGVEFGKARLG